MSNAGPGEPGSLTVQNLTLRRGFTALPNAVMDIPALSRDAKYLYAVLLRHAWKHGRCYPGYTVLQTEMGCGLRQIGQYLRELESVPLLLRTRRGRGLTTIYTLLDAPDAGKGISSSSETEGLDLPKRNAKEDSLEKDSFEESSTPNGVALAVRRQDLIWEALVSVFGDPLLANERSNLNGVCAKFRDASDRKELPHELCAARIKQAAANWSNVMGDASFTPNGLVKYFTILLEGPQVNGRSNGTVMKHTQSLTESALVTRSLSTADVLRQREQQRLESQHDHQR